MKSKAQTWLGRLNTLSWKHDTKYANTKRPIINIMHGLCEQIQLAKDY